MPVKLRCKMELGISSSTHSEDKDLGNQKYDLINDSAREGGSWLTVLPGSASDVRLNAGNIAAMALLHVRTTVRDPLQTLGTVQLRLNSPTGVLFDVRPLGRMGLFILTGDISEVYATNLGTSDVNVTLSAIGD